MKKDLKQKTSGANVSLVPMPTDNLKQSLKLKRYNNRKQKSPQ